MTDLVNYVITVALVIIFVGALMGPIADFFIGANRTGDAAGYQGNVTGAVGTLSALIPIMFIVAVLIIIWANARKGAGKK